MNIETIKRLCPEFAGKSALTIDRLTQLLRGIPLADPSCYAEMRQVVSELTEALAEARQALEWRPIESAPTNQSLLFYSPMFTGNGVFEGLLKDDRLVVNADYSIYAGSEYYPTYWMPLPTPPSVKEG